MKTSPCCNESIVWLAFSTDYKKYPGNRGKKNYYACARCKENVKKLVQGKVQLGLKFEENDTGK